MSHLDYQQVANQIKSEKPEGMKVDIIRVNFDKIDLEVSPKVGERIRNRFEEIAKPILNRDLSVIGDTGISEKWDYSLVCSFGHTPMFDSSKEQYYCPVCENKKTIFDY